MQLAPPRPKQASNVIILYSAVIGHFVDENYCMLELLSFLSVRTTRI